MKYVETLVTFSEIPGRISLCINISNCPCHCQGCHSTHLWQDIGTELTKEELAELINKNVGINTVCFMGGDAEPGQVNLLAEFIRDEFPNLQVGWYSGRDEIAREIELKNFDYIKIGPYIQERGPLNQKGTNQILYKVNNNLTLDDITDKIKR